MNYENIAKTVESFIREKTQGFNGGVIGLSGGIDSAVVAYLAVNAIGKDKVYGLMLPYGNQSTKDSEKIANILGIEYKIIDIKPVVEVNERISPQYFKTEISKGNLMARARMCFLYGASNSRNMLVLGTGNKSEFEIGYFTKYGDGGVDIEPIGELYKTEVWKLAKYLGVPNEIIEKIPSAELWEGQTDEDEIGVDYFTLDKILKGKTEGIDKAKIKRVETLVRNAYHKKTMPPMAKIER